MLNEPGNPNIEDFVFTFDKVGVTVTPSCTPLQISYCLHQALQKCCGCHELRQDFLLKTRFPKLRQQVLMSFFLAFAEARGHTS